MIVNLHIIIVATVLVTFRASSTRQKVAHSAKARKLLTESYWVREASSIGKHNGIF